MSDQNLTDIDVFLSYSFVDDQATEDGPDGGWVSGFGRDLEKSLEQSAGRPVSIWVDRHSIENSKDFSEQIRNVIERAQILVPILSPAYIESPELRQELSHFIRVNAETTDSEPVRVFPVVRGLLNTDQIPDILRNIQYTDFRNVDSEGDQSGEYWDRITKFADAVARPLIQLSDTPAVTEPPVIPTPGDHANSIAEFISAETGIDQKLAQDCQRLLSAAVKFLGQKSAEKNVLSTSTVFLAAVEWGLSSTATPRPPEALARLAQSLVSPVRNRYDEILSGFFITTPPTLNLNLDVYESPSFQLSVNLKQALHDSADPVKGPITAPDLVLSILRHSESADYTGTWFPDRLKQLDANLDELSNTLLNSTSDEQRSSDQQKIDAEDAKNDSPIWLCQYRRSEMRTLESRLKPGLEEQWRTSPLLSDELKTLMNNGDTVVFWRTIDEVKPENSEKSRGGIVGWGKIHNTPDDINNGRIIITVTHAFPENPSPRDEVLKALKPEQGNWPGQVSLKLLDSDEVKIIREFYPSLKPGSKSKQPIQEFHQTELASDRAETTCDRLGRAPLAFTLAHHINRIWTEQTKFDEKNEKNEKDNEDKHKHVPDKAAFILHIDSPWGGGKTTFANFISRILNPESFKLNPKKWEKNEPSLFRELRLGEEEYWPKKYRARKWITATFNAWQHQHVSPPWWNFYETLRKQCLEALPTGRRVSSEISELGWRIWSPEFRRTLLVILIIALLIIVLALEYGVSERVLMAFRGSGDPLVWLVSIVTIGSGLFALFTSIRSGVRKIVDGVSSSSDEISLGEADPLRRFRRHFARSIEQYKRPVLVIVDDLDRCEPKYVVELVRGMLTIFRSPRVVFLLLGDKNWIETSFAVVHQEMASSHRDRNISFGGRFVEKAIQLSFILPEPESTKRDAYIEHLLVRNETGRIQNQHLNQESRATTILPGDDQEDVSAQVEAEQTEILKKLRGASSGNERRAVAEKALSAARVRFGDTKETQSTFEPFITREEGLLSASSMRTEMEIRHSLSHVKGELPNNPRRIKRIINMIAVYQSSALFVLRVRPGTIKWKQLVLWIILMSEYPEAWRILSAHPELAKKVINGKADGRKLPAATSTDENPELSMLVVLKRKPIARLIKGEGFNRKELKHETVHLDEEAVVWLSRLTPLS